MPKKLSIILTNTNRSKIYFDLLKKENFFIDNIIYYSKTPDSAFINKLKKYPHKIKFIFIKINNINLKSVEHHIININSDYILFSGYNAEIVTNQSILKKNLIHCHPGLLPKYRGSTVIYYGLIEMQKIYVSIFNVSKNIDNGKVLFSKQISLPKNLIDIEKNFDNQIRAKTLVTFLKSKKINIMGKNDKYINFYYIAHPIVRSIILNPKQLLDI
jgi:methionyl-tRNA formyltransferase